MSEYGLAIFIMSITIVIILTGISHQLGHISDNTKTNMNTTNTNSCYDRDCPTWYEQYFQGKTRTIVVDIHNEKQCKESFPKGFYHTILFTGDCQFVVWKEDCREVLASLNNTGEKDYTICT